MTFEGLIIGLGTFLIIGLFHPLVIKGEYHYGTRFWWVFLVAGIVFGLLSTLVSNVLVSSLLGVASFSSFWGILEVHQQEKRVQRGWFPRNPKRTYWWDEASSSTQETDKKHQ